MNKVKNLKTKININKSYQSLTEMFVNTKFNTTV